MTATATGVVLSGRCRGRVYRLWFTVVYSSRLASTSRGCGGGHDTRLERGIVRIGDLVIGAAE
jgi:hypothetical protein